MCILWLLIWLYISGFVPCTRHSGRVICFYYLCVLWCSNWCDLEINWNRRLYCVEWTQYSIRQKRSAICSRCFPGPTRIVDANGISIASAVIQGSLGDRPTDRPTDHATRSATIGGAHSGEAKFCNCLRQQKLQQVFIGAVDSNTQCQPFLRNRSPNGATRNFGRRHPIAL